MTLLLQTRIDTILSLIQRQEQQIAALNQCLNLHEPHEDPHDQEWLHHLTQHRLDLLECMEQNLGYLTHTLQMMRICLEEDDNDDDFNDDYHVVEWYP